MPSVLTTLEKRIAKLEMQLPMAQQQLEFVWKEARLSQEEAQETATLLQEEQEFGQAVRAATTSLQEVIKKHGELYN